VPHRNAGLILLLTLAIVAAAVLPGQISFPVIASPVTAGPFQPVQGNAWKLAPGAVPGTWDSGLAIQNLYPIAQTAIVEFFEANGARASMIPLALPPYGSEGVWLPAVAALPSGRSFSASISAEQPVAYVSMEINQVAGIGETYTNGSPGYRVEIPVAFRSAGPGGPWSTRLILQNTGNGVTRPTLRFQASGPRRPRLLTCHRIPYPLPASRNYDLNAADFAVLGPGFEGSISINGDQPLLPWPSTKRMSSADAGCGCRHRSDLRRPNGAGPSLFPQL